MYKKLFDPTIKKRKVKICFYDPGPILRGWIKRYTVKHVEEIMEM
jgi:hypothetical protein